MAIYVDTSGLFRQEEMATGESVKVSSVKMTSSLNSILQNLVRLEGFRTSVMKMASEVGKGKPEAVADGTQDQWEAIMESQVREELVEALHGTFKAMLDNSGAAIEPALMKNFLDKHSGNILTSKIDGDAITLYHAIMQTLQQVESVEFEMAEIKKRDPLETKTYPTNSLRITLPMLRLYGVQSDINEAIKIYSSSGHMLTSLPDELVISIEGNIRGGGKETTRCVNYDTLFVSDPENERNEIAYSVVGVVVNSDEENHYVAYIKKTNHSWMLFDDDNKTETKEITENENIVVMFYTRNFNQEPLICPHGCRDIFTTTDEVWNHVKFSELHIDSTFEQCGIPSCQRRMFRDIVDHCRDYHLHTGELVCPFQVAECETFNCYSSLEHHIQKIHKRETGQIKRKPREKTLADFYKDENAVPDLLVQKLEQFGRPDDGNIHHQGQFILGSVNPETSAVRWGMDVLTAGRQRNAGPEPCKGKFVVEEFLGRNQLTAFGVQNIGWNQLTPRGIRNITYEMGHLISPRNHQKYMNAYQQAFKMGNIFPMREFFNKGAWQAMNRHAVRMTKYYDCITSFAGPSKKTIILDAGCGHKVPVPKYFWRILIMEKADKVPQVQAFLFPHEDETQGIFNHRSTVAEINIISGLNLLGNMNGGFEVTWDTADE